MSEGKAATLGKKAINTLRNGLDNYFGLSQNAYPNNYYGYNGPANNQAVRS